MLNIIYCYFYGVYLNYVCVYIYIYCILGSIYISFYLSARQVCVRVRVVHESMERSERVTL